MEEIHIFLHDKTRSYRIKELEDAGYKENESCDKTAESFQSQKEIIHIIYFKAESTTAFTFSNIAPGGSIMPYSSEQSILMNLGSSSHCL